jgi:hypothetical protein
MKNLGSQGNIDTIKKATIYFQSDLLGNIIGLKVKNLTVVRCPWAQFKSAVHAKYVPYRKRTECSYTKGYKPYLIVLEGWKHPLPGHESTWNTKKETDGVVVEQARHAPFSNRWNNEFDTFIEDYVDSNPKVKVLGDYRNVDTNEASYSKEFNRKRQEYLKTQFLDAGVDENDAEEASHVYVEQGSSSAIGSLSHKGYCAYALSYRGPGSIGISHQNHEPVVITP